MAGQLLSGEAADTHTHTGGHASISGAVQKFSRSGCGVSETIRTNQPQLLSSQTEHETDLRGDWRGAFDPVDVDAQVTTPPHFTKRVSGTACLSGGRGCTEQQATGTRKIHSGEGWSNKRKRRSDVPVLAVALPSEPDGLERTSASWLRPKGSRILRREFNPDPKVADFLSAEEVMTYFLHDY